MRLKTFGKDMVLIWVGWTLANLYNVYLLTWGAFMITMVILWYTVITKHKLLE